MTNSIQEKTKFEEFPTWTKAEPCLVIVPKRSGVEIHIWGNDYITTASGKRSKKQKSTRASIRLTNEQLTTLKQHLNDLP